MENRLDEIRKCRAQIQILGQQLNELSVKISVLEKQELEASTNVSVQTHQSERVHTPQPASVPAQKNQSIRISQNLENKVGKNLFAVVASLLVLIGVGVFISTIYAYIPEIVKIIAIYLFGFVMLGGGLGVYLRNKNRFWLGVASCGLAELLVSIITSHSYFGVLSLGWTFGLILLWIVTAFWLTKFQPTVFKTIGYIGFVISILLGLSLVTVGAVPIYLTLLGAFSVLSVFFVLINPSHVKMNTVLIFVNTVSLCLFLFYEYVLPDHLWWVNSIIAFIVLGVYHGLYLLRGKLNKDVFPLFAALSVAVLSVFIRDYHIAVIIPISMGLLFTLWLVNLHVTSNRTTQVIYSVFMGVYIFVLSFSADSRLSVWFVCLAGAAYGLYWLTKRNTIAWVGFVCFFVFYAINATGQLMVLLSIFAMAMAAFAVKNFTKLLPKDTALEIAWYLLTVIIAVNLIIAIEDKLILMGHYHMSVRSACDGAFYCLLAIANTAYLHFAVRDPERVMRVTAKGVFAMIVQGLVMVNCMCSIDSHLWYVVILGIVGSLLVTSYSLLYSIKTRGSNKKLMVWQFIKFSLYCWAVLTILESPSILVNISLLLIAICAVVIGFRLDQKSVRIYGLALSLLDVVSLILFNVDYSDSLKLAGGIVLCGALCFVISFIYTKISKAAAQKR